VSGADSLEVARTVARKVASSNLVKASMHKEDQNWGRVMAAIGSTGVEMDINATSIEFNMQPVEVQISIDFRRGNFTATAWGCDMEYDSIRTSSSKVDMAKILAEVG
jgi:glutamate N-acetyltransferase / amino-acid N-acetyltransferase